MLVYSKGVLNHVSDKSDLFRQIFSVSKHSSIFVIADWIFPQGSTDSIAPLVCETKESYERVLTNAGFTEVVFRDDSQLFLCDAKDLLLNLKNHQFFIEQNFGQELFSAIWCQHELLVDKINQRQKIATRITAKKV